MRTVVVAMDKFKGSATAEQVCSSVCQGVADASMDWMCQQFPLADGGDGTVQALVRAGWAPHPVTSIDAQGLPVTAEVARSDGSVVVELAAVCGIARWRGPLQPWRAHTIGLGIAIREQIEAGAREIVIAVGGSASTDGGLGALMGLGFRITDEHGREVEPGLVGLRSAVNIEFPHDIDLLRSCRWTVLVDVDSPLYGPHGAAWRFGPQKGLSSHELGEADALLTRWESVLARVSGRNVGAIDGVGAAGGVAAPFVALFEANLHSGFEFIAEQLGLPMALAAADLVITGEGHVDATSLSGKVVGEVLALSDRAGVEAVVLAGGVADEVLGALPETVLTLIDLAGSTEEAVAAPCEYLRRAGGLIVGSRG